MYKEFKKKILSILKGNHYPKKPKLINATSDWLKILIIAPLFLFVVMAFNFYFFYLIRSGDVFSSTSSGLRVLEIVDREMLADTIEHFETESSRLDQLKLETPSFVDPAL